jgi:hypothetical protein
VGEVVICVLCTEPIADWTTSVAIGPVGSDSLGHRECLLRNVLGGIGHLLDHQHWCIQMHDPDGGMTYRESAIAVDHWVTQRAEKGA